MKKFIITLLAAALMTALFSGCGEDYMKVRIAYVRGAEAYESNSNSSSIAYETRKIAKVGMDRAYRLALQLAMTQPESGGLVTLIPAQTKINRLQLKGNIAELDLSSEYSELEGISRTLADYCMTMTLCNFDGIEGVIISVEGEGTGVVLRPADIVDSRDRLRLKEYDVHLYFPNAETGELTYVDAIICVSDASEPASDAARMLIQGQKGLKLVGGDGSLPVLLSIKVQNRICSVNLSRSFITNSVYNSDGVNLSAYAVINTLCQFPNVDKVKIMVIGAPAGEALGLGSNDAQFPNVGIIEER